MLFRFASYCRNQQFIRQIIRKPFTPFCFSDQDIHKLIKNLIELREKQNNCGFGLECEQLSKQILPYENDLNSYLTKFMVHKRDPYYLFRKHLIKLAYLSYVYGNSSIKYTECAMCGDYENHYKDELTKQVFLAELYGIKLRIQQDGKQEEFAAKSLALWQNVIENHCQFYKQWKEKKSFDIDALTKNMEFIYYDQYLECYVGVLRELYQCGVFEKLKSYFEEAQTRFEETIQIILYLKKGITNINSAQSVNYQEFVANLTNIQQILAQQLVYGKELIENILKKNIANQVQIFHLQILKEYIESFLRQQSNETALSIDDMFNNIKNTQQQNDRKEVLLTLADTVYFLQENKIVEQQKQILIDNGKVFEFPMDLYLRCLEDRTFENLFDDILKLSSQIIELLLVKKFTKHYISDSVIFSILYVAYRKHDVEVLQVQIHQILNQIFRLTERPQDKIVKFFQLIVELEMKSEINQINQDLLQKIKEMEFEQPLIKYQKKRVLEHIYKNYGLKQDENQKNNIV